MRKKKTANNSGKHKHAKDQTPKQNPKTNRDTHPASGGELHQIAEGKHPDFTTNQGVALAHNVSAEKEVDEFVSQAVTAGATLVKKPQKVFWGGHSGYFNDLDGHLWEVAYNPLFRVGPADENNKSVR